MQKTIRSLHESLADKKYKVAEVFIYRSNRKKIRRWYVDSEYPRKIRKLKNMHKGRRCFLIGNGPSLRAEDLNKLKEEISFSSNKIYKMFDKTSWRPYYYIIGDQKYSCEIDARKIPARERFVGLENVKKPIKTYKDSDVILYSKVTDLKDGYIPVINEEADKFLYTGHTVLFEAFEIALYMGCNEFYLLGVDCDYTTSGTHFYNSGQQTYTYDHASYMRNAWMAIKEYAETHNIKVYNASRSGKLDFFERVDFDNIL